MVVLAGAVCDFRMDYGRVLNPKSKVIIVNRSRDDLVLNTGLTGFWSATQSVEAQLGLGLGLGSPASGPPRSLSRPQWPLPCTLTHEPPTVRIQ